MPRRLSPTSILSEAEVRTLAARVKELFPVTIPDHLMPRLGIEAGIRFGAVAAKCREGREAPRSICGGLIFRAPGRSNQRRQLKKGDLTHS
jgi:hypothetical protein